MHLCMARDLFVSLLNGDAIPFLQENLGHLSHGGNLECGVSSMHWQRPELMSNREWTHSLRPTAGLNSELHEVPNTFDRIEIWRVRWPLNLVLDTDLLTFSVVESRLMSR